MDVRFQMHIFYANIFLTGRPIFISGHSIFYLGVLFFTYVYTITQYIPRILSQFVGDCSRQLICVQSRHSTTQRRRCHQYNRSVPIHRKGLVLFTCEMQLSIAVNLLVHKRKHLQYDKRFLAKTGRLSQSVGSS